MSLSNSARLEKMITEESRKFYFVAFRILGDQDMAMDAFQNSCVNALRSVDKFRGDSSLSTWFYTILINSCRKQLSVWNRLGRIFSHTDLEQFSSSEEDDGEDAEKLKLVMDEVGRLSSRQKEAMILRYSEGLSIRDISIVMGCSEGTVKSHINRGVTAVRTRLFPDSEESVDMAARACDAKLH
ncbi:MAG: RNA polymerase sigma factor [Deltaproteobacteria bacterium]|nr:RNA polymerase sigma factor [Deltaproteobacteria bacterium]